MMVARALVVLILLIVPSLCLADTGSVFLSFKCDQSHQTLGVEPKIIWNEELDKVNELMKENGSNGVVAYDNGLLIDADHVDKVHICKIGEHTLSVSVPDMYNPALEITTDGSHTASIKLGYVVAFYGPVFRLQFTPKKKWEEFCGREEDAVAWTALDPKTETTDCPNSSRQRAQHA
jgi:hypothetical protein